MQGGSKLTIPHFRWYHTTILAVRRSRLATPFPSLEPSASVAGRASDPGADGRIGSLPAPQARMKRSFTQAVAVPWPGAVHRRRAFPIRIARRGFTLIEVVVVLVLVGLVFGLVTPRFLAPAPAREGGVHRVVEAARRAAIRRAGAVTLSLDAEGGWNVEAAGEPGSAPLLAGRLDSPPPSALRLHVSPLGSCMLVPSEDVAPRAIDPVRCRLTEE